MIGDSAGLGTEGNADPIRVHKENSSVWREMKVFPGRSCAAE